ATEPKREQSHRVNIPEFVRVAPELGLDRLFDYAIPSRLRGQIELGQRLRVPWGKRMIMAYAVEFPDQPEVEQVKEVEEVAGKKPLIPSSLCRLARWMADYYACDLGAALRTILPGPVRSHEGEGKMAWWISPVIGQEEVADRTLRGAKAQKKAWLHLASCGGGWLTGLVKETGLGTAVWRALVDRGLAERSERRWVRTEEAPESGWDGAERRPDLAPEQTVAMGGWEEERKKEGGGRPILLEGVTGSGKTEIYLRAMEKTLEEGKNVVILVPEISLTPQTVARFRGRLVGQKIRLAVLHSGQTVAERRESWHEIREGRVRVVIGARSALFAPLENLGLIVVDEEHDGGYKQAESPRYQARDLAVVRGKMEGASVVLGSATPCLESGWNADRERYRRIRLTQRVDGAKLPKVHIVDLRKEDKPKGGGPTLLSAELKSALQGRVGKGEQSLVLLNRRGYAPSVQCPHCGKVEECDRCAVPMTYHRSEGKLRCHFCDADRLSPSRCRECGSPVLHYTGAGTERLQEAVEEAIPKVRLTRMDSDSMKARGAHGRALTEFRERRTDILLGTQMIAKGLHFPNVTCVGVVGVDGALNLPDFRASERVFQLLVQVAGRAGRGEVAGEVFVQTYTPFHPAIQFARHHDVDGFREQELEYRKAHLYPPFRRAILLSFSGPSEAQALASANHVVQRLRALWMGKVDVPDPSPAPIARVEGRFRFHVFLLVDQVARVIGDLKREVLAPKWPSHLQVSVDVDPQDLL
ncbi:MAG: primosomal protein N', partial [Verrucomicrobia bacterium]|nr:primosomal protein N' [Verrucomicrobiota bacterium]